MRQWRSSIRAARWERTAGGVPLRGQHRPGEVPLAHAASCFPFNRRRERGSGHQTRAYDSTAAPGGPPAGGAGPPAPARPARLDAFRRGAYTRSRFGARVRIPAHAVERETGHRAAPRPRSTCAAPATVSDCIAKRRCEARFTARARHARPGHWMPPASGKAKRRGRQPGYRPERRNRRARGAPGPARAGAGGSARDAPREAARCPGPPAWRPVCDRSCHAPMASSTDSPTESFPCKCAKFP